MLAPTSEENIRFSLFTQTKTGMLRKRLSLFADMWICTTASMLLPRTELAPRMNQFSRRGKMARLLSIAVLLKPYEKHPGRKR